MYRYLIRTDELLVEHPGEETTLETRVFVDVQYHTTANRAGWSPMLTSGADVVRIIDACEVRGHNRALDRFS